VASRKTDPELYDVTAERAQHYRDAFTGTHGAHVMADLAEFCKADKSHFSDLAGKNGQTDPYLMAYYAGRRDVYERILKWSEMDADLILKTLIDRRMQHG